LYFNCSYCFLCDSSSRSNPTSITIIHIYLLIHSLVDFILNNRFNQQFHSHLRSLLLIDNHTHQICTLTNSYEELPHRHHWITYHQRSFNDINNNKYNSNKYSIIRTLWIRRWRLWIAIIKIKIVRILFIHNIRSNYTVIVLSVFSCSSKGEQGTSPRSK